MKNFYLIVTALLLPALAAAQTQGEASVNADTLAGRIGLVDSQGREVMAISDSPQEGNTFSLSVLGMDIDFGRQEYTGDDYTRIVQRGRFAIDMLNEVAFGMNFLTSPDYSMYPDGTPEFLDLKNGKSWQIKMNIADFLYYLNKRRTVTLGMGVALKASNYSFRHRYEIVKRDGMIHPEYIPEERGNYKASSYATVAIALPLTVRVRLYDRLHFRGGVYGEFIVGQQTTVRKPKVITVKDFGARTFQMGVTGQLEYGAGFVYFDYGFSPLFRSGVGPKTHPFSAGIGIRYSY